MIMQFLANENFPLDVVEALRKEGHEVAWLSQQSARVVIGPGISASSSLVVFA
jgi:hypothetical protein